MRNLLRDLKSNLLDNATFRRELENILKDPTLSSELRDELAKNCAVGERLTRSDIQVKPEKKGSLKRKC